MTSSTPPRPQWRDAVAGACAGIISKSVMAPIERIKLIMQLENCTHENKGASRSMFRLAKSIYHEQGVYSFWRGNLPAMLRTAGTAALNFTLMDYYKRLAVNPYLERNVLVRHNTTAAQLERRRHFFSSLLSGGMAGGTATTILYPFEYIRTRLAMDMGSGKKRQYRGTFDALRWTFQRDGVLGLYQGYGVALFGGIIFRVLLLGGYDAVKYEIIARKKRLGLNPTLLWWERFGTAQLTSILAGTLSYPFDSVRRRMMMQAGMPICNREYRSGLHCFYQVFAREGLRGFYKGLGANLIRSVGGALLLYMYDTFRSNL